MLDFLQGNFLHLPSLLQFQRIGYRSHTRIGLSALLPVKLRQKPWLVPEVTVRHPSQTAGFPHTHPKLQVFPNARSQRTPSGCHKGQRTSLACKQTALTARKPRGAEPHEVNDSPPIRQSNKSPSPLGGVWKEG